MRTDAAPTIYRTDYAPYPYAVPRVALEFDLEPDTTTVTATLTVARTDQKPHAQTGPSNEATETLPGPTMNRAHHPALVLNGEDLTLVSVALNGHALQPGDYTLTPETLTLQPEAFARCATDGTDTFGSHELRIVSQCSPAKNTSLMGLYVSGDKLFTQCEAEGFRRITWFPDRPDVMSRYQVTLRASKAQYPLLLSNGNLVSEATLPDGRHQACWEDPHPKPAYLFAIVAGNFDCREKTVHTRSGRPVQLQVYSDCGSYDKTEWALDCLERSLRWDETRFGLELDLDRFMIVAARDFNMGAMENKGLNIFNSAYVLADPNTATDAVYRAVEAVIGHEYFHNWTGNRVTCRDWFQLSLKEGLTVFRDQEFSADMLATGLAGAEAASARAVKRIDDVTTLRVAQFPEDAGPMAHPIRPESYQEIGNFYTATVYEKGAEVIRMQHTLLGEPGFRAGIDEYFQRHDGQAVTCDDFINAMESVYVQRNPGRNLNTFRQWYRQAGTPQVSVRLDYNAENQVARITLRQSCPPVGVEKLQNPPQAKPPLHIPFAIGLLDANGQALPIAWHGTTTDTALLELTEDVQSWDFPGVPSRPVLSLLRGFSAPVSVDYPRDTTELILLAAHDPDPFARWEAAHELASRQLLALVRAFEANKETVLDPAFVQAWQRMAADATLTAAYKARILALPGERELLEKTRPLDPINTVRARRCLKEHLGRQLAQTWHQLYEQASTQTQQPYSPDPVSAGWRSLKNLALSYLVAGRHEHAEALAEQQYYQATNMTDRMGGLNALVHGYDTEATTRALDHFHDQWQHDALVTDKWFTLQATARTTTAETVQALMLHPAFSLRNPNRARALIFQFCINNLSGVHTPEGYAFWADQVLALDAINPEIAARLARTFDNWQRFVPTQRTYMKAALERIQAHETLSRNVAEIINKALTL